VGFQLNQQRLAVQNMVTWHVAADKPIRPSDTIYHSFVRFHSLHAEHTIRGYAEYGSRQLTKCLIGL